MEELEKTESPSLKISSESDYNPHLSIFLFQAFEEFDRKSKREFFRSN